MLTIEIDLNKILAMKGQICTFHTRKAVKVRKGAPQFTKESMFQGRIGIQYDNMATVQEKREDGRLPSENQGLTWGEWLFYPYIISHNGKRYLRVSKANSNVRYPSKYFDLNGNEVSAEIVKMFALASEFAPKSDVEVLAIPMDNIVDIKGI
jgi:hypothetical protein